MKTKKMIKLKIKMKIKIHHTGLHCPPATIIHISYNRNDAATDDDDEDEVT